MRFVVASSLLCLLGNACSSEMHPKPAADREIRIERLASPEGNVWWLGTADFNLDGHKDILIAGHRCSHGAHLFYANPSMHLRENEAPSTAPRVLGAERDRHGCAVADITGNTYPDIFCVSGAERGGGGNDNELWRNLNGHQFEQVTNHGAEQPYARGRRAGFFNFDGQYPPELVTTVWGDRTDAQENRSQVWRWTGKHFEAMNTVLGEKQGGRCLVVFDVNGDGLDDLLTCGEKQGFSLLLNNGKLDFEERFPGGAALGNTWWWDAALTPGKAGQPSHIAFIVEPIGEQNIHIGTLSATLKLSARNYIPCSFATGLAKSDVYCARVLWHDFNADGIHDLYVVRRSDRERVSPQGDVDDLIILGPAYDAYLTVKRSNIGAGTEAISAGSDVVRLTAGENWPGALEIIRVVNSSDA